MKPHEQILQMLATVSKDDEKTLDTYVWSSSGYAVPVIAVHR